MKQEFDEELIVNVIDRAQNLGLDGFYFGMRDEQFLESQNELKKSIDKIIVCLEWLDRGLGFFTYFANEECLASEVKEMIQHSQHSVIPLGCVITALLYFRGRIYINKKIVSQDLVFALQEYERLRRERTRRICYEMDL